MEHYEKLYIEESGDKKPDIKKYRTFFGTKHLLFWEDYFKWYNRFSLWLCKRLEKAEKENKEKTEWSLKILKRLNKVDSLLDRCSGTIASGTWEEERREDIEKLLDELAHFNQE
jgi:hypothetical protein